MRASEVLSAQTNVDTATVTDRFLESGSLWIQPSELHPTATPVAFFDTDDDHLVIVRAAGGIRIPAAWGGRDEQVKALFFLAGCSAAPGRALRLAGELAAYLHSDRAEAVAEAAYEAEVKEALLPDLSIGQYPLLPELSTAALIGRRVGGSPSTGASTWRRSAAMAGCCGPRPTWCWRPTTRSPCSARPTACPC